MNKIDSGDTQDYIYIFYTSIMSTQYIMTGFQQQQQKMQVILNKEKT